ncbi:low molecular weight protein arginine phosphatase [Paenibacillus sp. J2TS4]|uniref:low molecular weight protein arginine phosphatase n=1 Tax=Paenibacillus sp. J2TS4 TaxID=2807194 RepID=UPI001B1AE161|nr:low molecular weight protein arginine phosphatase [Paenibacillus sp. J2TS4]GIP35538.1 protein-arginine-phosphatase [Paenibacillus sp. J2TS4]
MAKQILFVCTGNTCRSPLAEGMLRMMAEEAGLKIDIRSAGTAASEGCPISPHSHRILQDKGMQGTLLSSPVSHEHVDWAELILTMTMNHKRSLIQQYPFAADKTFTLKEYVRNDSEAALQSEQEKTMAELEIKKALSQSLSEDEVQQWVALASLANDYDIVDPFGGSYETYKQCADEIEHCLHKLLNKLAPDMN